MTMPTTSNRPRAVVLLSGGLDSATTLAIANETGYDCYCLSLDYGQRHRVELDAASRVAKALNACEQRVMRLALGEFGGSALTDAAIDVPVDGVGPGIPVTYVPARNTIMLSLALAWAEVLGSRDIFVGSTPSTIRATRIAAPNSSRLLKPWPTWRRAMRSKAKS